MASNRTTSRKLIASVALLAGAAGVAGLGTYGSFTSTTTASAAVASGTMKIELGAPGSAANRLTLGATGLVPGDTIQRAVTLNNTGNQGLAGISLTTTALPSSKLDTDPTNGLQLLIESCSAPWTEAGTSPACPYTCSGTTKTVLDSRPVIGQNLALGDVLALGAGKADNLRVKLTLPAAADDSFQGQNSTLSFSFTGMQRAATNK
jgi:hypothetical protein